MQEGQRPANGGDASAAVTDEPGTAAASPVRQVLDTSELKSSYCNVFTGNATREEIVLNFGVDQAWDRTRSDRIQLTHRIILSPFAAKRVSQALNSMVSDYEKRHGELK